MHSGRLLSVASLLVALAASSCNGSAGGGSSNSILSIEQDLSLDPSGQTTVVTFMSDPGALDTPNFEADGGQTAQTVTQNASAFTVVWDARVGPASEVRAMSVADVSSAFHAVSTSDASVPTFAISAATQVLGLGADTISVQFSGPRVIESEAENPSNWTLKVGTTTLLLAGSTFTLDNPSQVLSITTGPLANLHASFTLAANNTLHSVADISLATTAIAGSATGDAVLPTLTSVQQNLTQDEYGRIVDITFSEAMDPLFCAPLSNFAGSGSDVATTFAQPVANVLRVTFNNPIVPGVNTIDLENLTDAHGNAFPDQNVVVVAGSTVANSFSSGPFTTTVEGSGGDALDVAFTQAIDPDDASDPAKWNLEIPTGNALNLANCVFTYDLLAKALSIELDVDVQNGVSFTFEPAAGNEPNDVDGQPFTTSAAGLVSGEVNPPTVVSATQNRVFDPTGATVDIVFSESLEEASAEALLNWDIAGHVAQTATLLNSKTIVRLDFDTPVLPGTDTLNVSGIADLAGNAMAAVVAHALTSTDNVAPSATSLTAQAVEGAANDIVRVIFNDNLIESEIENIANWTLESPVGTPLSLVGASAVWNNGGRQATVTLSDGTDLTGGDITRAGFSGIHDIAGNTISAATVSASVTAEVNSPEIDSMWVKSALTNHVTVRFTEPCSKMDDIAGLTHYVVRNSVGVVKGSPTTATESVDHLGVELVFGFAVVAGSDTLDVAGVTDLAGNSMFPVSLHAVATQNLSAVSFDGPSSDMIAVSGESNDVVVIEFATRPSRWNLLRVSNYTISLLGNPIDLSGATFSFDGAQTVTISLDANWSPNLQTGLSYDVDISAMNSAQGVAGSAMSGALVCGGESSAPSLPVGLTRIDAANPSDSVLLQFGEAVDLSSAQTLANYDLNGGPNPDSVVRVGLTTVRATWNGGVVVGDTVNANVADLAGNIGVVSRVVGNVDPQGPLVVSVDGLSVANSGLDTVTVQFDKPVEPLTALDSSNYGVTNVSALVLGSAVLRFNSTNNTVTIRLPAGVELDPTQGISVHVEDVKDHAGLAMSPPANIGGAVSGDLTAAAFSAAFANYRVNASGLAIDVRFSEDIPTSFASTLTNWTVSGGQTVVAVVALTPSHYRLTLSAALTAGHNLAVTAVPDMAGNLSGSISIAPTL